MESGYVSKTIANKKKIFNEKIALLASARSKWSKGEIVKTERIEFEYNNAKKDVPPIQDLDEVPVMVGADVVALYPSMDGVVTAELAAQSIRETNVSFKGVDYKVLAVYIKFDTWP